MRHFRLLESLQRLSAHRWLKAIRNSLVLLLPVTFIGAMAMLLGSFPFAVVFPHLDSLIGNVWRDMALLIADASGGILSLCLVVLISHYLAVEASARKVVGVSPALVATIALVNFFVYIRLFSADVGLAMLGARSVLAAIVIAVVSTEVFFRVLRIKVLKFENASYELDPSLNQAVVAIVPAIATIALFLLACRSFLLFSPDFNQSILVALRFVTKSFDNQLPSLLILTVLHQFLWFIGIHGSNVLDGVLYAAFSFAGNANQVFDIPKIFFDLYAHIGGSGSTLGLLFAILINVPQGEARQVAKYALIPSLFNINELMLFGLPIVFNPIYLIPFLLAPVAQIVLSYLCVRSGLVVLDVTPVPWMTPPILGGMLNSGSWHGGALQCIDIFISVLVYTPFVRIAEREKRSENVRNIRHVLVDIESLQRRHSNVLDRHDEIGNTARKLLSEFLHDFAHTAETGDRRSNRVAARVFLAYQPQHDRLDRIVGVEALLRWQNRQLGFVSPAVLCALLEESGQIIPYGRWAIGNACARLQAWKNTGTGIGQLRMSVNLSPLQLRDAGLLSFVRETLAAHQLQAFELGLELTESQRIPEDAISIQTLKGLEALGVHLEMDDFGMGYSSMFYIRSFQFNAIKLDGLLTRDVLLDNNCRDIIASVVQLSEVLGIEVVAEFVESREQQALLERLGCTAFQGYLYSPALSGDKCREYLLRHVPGAAATLPTSSIESLAPVRLPAESA